MAGLKMQCSERSVHLRLAGMRSSSAPSFNSTGTESFNSTSGLNASGSPAHYVHRDTDPLPVSCSASISEEVDLGPAHSSIPVANGSAGVNGGASGDGKASYGMKHEQHAPMHNTEWDRGLAAAFNGTALGVDSRKFGDAKKMVRATFTTSRVLRVSLSLVPAAQPTMGRHWAWTPASFLASSVVNSKELINSVSDL